MQWSIDVGPNLWGSRTLAVMPGGDVVLGVCSKPFCFSQDGSAVTAAIVRISSAGKTLWTTRVPGTGFSSIDADGRGRTLAVVDAPDAPRIVLVGDAGGILLDAATDIAFPRASLGGESGDFVVAGQEAATGKPVFERRRSDGGTRFRATLDVARGAVDRVSFAPNGSIALGGWFEGRLQWGGEAHDAQFGSGFVVVGGGDGSPQWSKADTGLSGSSASVPPCVAFGRDNDVVTFTQTFGKGQANLRSYTRDGAQRWIHEFGGIFGTWVNAVAVARNGDVVVGGNGTADAPFKALPFAKTTQYVAVIAP
ncbi:MAG TPA: hypothetical protein VFK85_06560 [Anaeromyxobacteraceae bacterium]|nr:hypothetical protein [Anaeromyxobacteraceae bacterium]